MVESLLPQLHLISQGTESRLRSRFCAFETVLRTLYLLYANPISLLLPVRTLAAAINTAGSTLTLSIVLTGLSYSYALQADCSNSDLVFFACLRGSLKNIVGLETQQTLNTQSLNFFVSFLADTFTLLTSGGLWTLKRAYAAFSKLGFIETDSVYVNLVFGTNYLLVSVVVSTQFKILTCHSGCATNLCA